MKLFRLKGKHNDPDAEKELVLDTGTDDAPVSERQSAPESEPTPAATEEVAAESPGNPADQPAPQDDLLAEIGAQADKEVAEQEEPAADAPSQDDDELDPSLLDIFKDAKTEVEEGSLAADLENIPAREVLEEMRAVVHGLGIPDDRLRERHDDEAGQQAADTAQGDAEDGGPDTEAGEAQADVGMVHTGEEPGDGASEERPPLTQAH